MRACEPFLPADLEQLDILLDRAYQVVPMEAIYDGASNPLAIGMRHDCDNVIHPAVTLAEWEYERGYQSTYYILHTSPYWEDKGLLRDSLDRIASCNHEIWIHNDALTVALETGRDPADVLHEAVDELRGYGHEIRSTVAHGNRLCHIARYVNDEMFLECERDIYGGSDRVLEHRGRRVQIPRVALAAFGLDFDASWLRRGDYLSDSGGQWSQSFAECAAAFPSRGQLHILQHPDWWGEAFERVAA